MNQKSIYAPLNGKYSAAELKSLSHALEEAQQARDHAEQALKIANDRVIDAEWAIHNGVQGAKAQVLAQYGSDAYELQVLGLKRKSDYRRPARRGTALEGA